MRKLKLKIAHFLLTFLNKKAVSKTSDLKGLNIDAGKMNKFGWVATKIALSAR